MGLSPATIIPNMDGRIQGWDTPSGYPSGGLKSRYGPVTMRRGIMSSLNVVAARTLMDYVTPAVGARYLALLGANMSKINVDGPGLALGTSGLTPIQMAAAYGAIANEGVYLEPLSFTKVIDGDGNVVLDAEQIRKSNRVYKESTAYLLIDMLTDAVKSGTGTKAKIDGMTVAGKTGTNSDYASVYFAGMTPYYVASVFVGHDYPANKLKNGASGGGYAAPLWKAFMEPIHEGLANGAIIDADPTSLGLVKKTVCSVSGLLATDACKDDEAHKPVTDWFHAASAPTAECDMHLTVAICSDSGSLATQFCPEDRVTKTSMILIRSDSQFAQFDDEYLMKALPNAIRSDAPIEEYLAGVPTCTVHADGSLSVFELKAQAEELIATVRAYLAEIGSIDAASRTTLEADIQQLEYVLSGYEYSQIEPLVSTLSRDYNAISQAYPLGN